MSLLSVLPLFRTQPDPSILQERPLFINDNTLTSALMYDATTGFFATRTIPSPLGTGDVIGPASSVATQVPIFADGTGKLLAASNVTIDAGGNIGVPTGTVSIAAGNLDLGNNSSITLLTNRFITTGGAAASNQNIFAGVGSGSPIVTAGGNVGVGFLSSTGLTSGSDNVSVGLITGSNLTTGSRNIIIGSIAGGVVSGNDNILFAATDVAAATGVIRIGTPGTQTTCFIAGVQGVSPGGTPQMVIINPATSQLGSQAIVTGVNTVGPISGASNANGATITGTTLNLAPADAVNGGVITNTTQSFLGAKTFINDASFSANINLVTTTAAAGIINVNGGSAMHFFDTASPSNNIFLGRGAGNFTGTGTVNVFIGSNNVGAGSAITTASGNVWIGCGACNMTSGQNNTILGGGAGLGLTSGSRNIMIGQNVTGITTGGDGIGIGCAGAATALSINIGIQGTQTSCIIAGISGVTTGGVAVPVLVDATGQLGTISSARKYKKDILSINATSSARIYQLDPVTFSYKKMQIDELGQEVIQFGLIADDVAHVIPEIVLTKAGEPETIRYDALVPLLLAELQRLAARVACLEAKNQST